MVLLSWRTVTKYREEDLGRMRTYVVAVIFHDFAHRDTSRLILSTHSLTRGTRSNYIYLINTMEVFKVREMIHGHGEITLIRRNRQERRKRF